MTENLIFDLTRETVWIAMVISAPMLGAALAAGVVIGLFQALTSVQEMTLTFVPKLGAILVVFWITMSFSGHTLVRFYQDRIIPTVTTTR